MSTPKRPRHVIHAALMALMLGGLVVAAVPVVRAQQSAQRQAPPPPTQGSFPKQGLTGETAEKHYENIQVLKNVPAEQIIPTMQYIAASLGVQCNYCHVQFANERDDKKTKLIARDMMKMVMDINQSSFDRDLKVGCFTCHNGSPIPRTSPPVVELGMRPAPPRAGERIPGEAGPPVPPRSTEVLPSADELVAKYEQAIGGAAAASLTTEVAKGAFEAGQARGEFEQFFKAPDKSYITQTTPQGRSAQGFDGNVAWQQNPQGRVNMLLTIRGFDLKRQADFYRTLELKKSYKNFHDVAKASVAGKDAYLILADEATGPGTDQLYFDVSSGLLVRAVQFTPSAFGEIPTQYDYSDYRDAGGVKVPFEVRFGKPESLTMYHFTEVKFNEPIEDARFTRPVDKPPAPATASR